MIGVIYLVQSRQAQEAAVVSPTAFVPTPTSTSTSTATATHTPTPLPTSTSTPVVRNDDQLEVSPATEEAPGTGEVTAAPEGSPTLNPTEIAATAAVSLPTAEGPAELTPTSTMVVQTPETDVTTTPTTQPEEMPQGGGVLPTSGGSIAIWAGGVLLLVLLLVGLIGHFRSSHSL